MDNHMSTNKLKPLVIALSLTLSFFFIEAIGGFIIGSLALIADAAHMLTDVTALIIAIVAIKLGQRPANKVKTYGYYRFEILAAAFNAALLFLLAFYILYEAYERIGNPPTLESKYMFIIATLGLSINIISMLVLRSHKDASLNINAAYLEILSDMLGSFGVLISAVLIYLFNWVWADSIIAILIGIWILPRAWLILKESINILLEGVPAGVNIDEIKSTLSAVNGVLDVHDLHIWAITSGKVNLTAHVVIDSKYECTYVIAQMKELLKTKFNITHSTLEDERKNCTDNDICNL